jgi:hypothetical protein
MMKIAVCDARSGSGIGPGRALLRRVIYWILFALFALPGVVNALWPLSDPRRQAWHDKAVKSLVVEMPSGDLIHAEEAILHTAWRLLAADLASIAATLLGVLAFFAAPLVWGTLGLLFAVGALARREQFAPFAIIVAICGMVIGTVVLGRPAFGYG